MLKKIVISLAAAIVICLTILVWKDNALNRSIHTLEPTWFGFVKISNHVYVNKAMSPGEQADFLKVVAAARKRVAHIFGGRLSHPKILACSTEQCFVPNQKGPTPKGQNYGDSAVMVSPRGLNVTILSHELTHSELYHRVGVKQTWHSIPSWFNEGLAVLVSQDSRYSFKAWCQATDGGRKAPNPLAIRHLLGHGSWLLCYGTAREMVGNWYASVGRAGLEKLIDDVRNGKNFLSSFKAIAKEYGEKPKICPITHSHNSSL